MEVTMGVFRLCSTHPRRPAGPRTVTQWSQPRLKSIRVVGAGRGVWGVGGVLVGVGVGGSRGWGWREGRVTTGDCQENSTQYSRAEARCCVVHGHNRNIDRGRLTVVSRCVYGVVGPYQAWPAQPWPAGTWPAQPWPAQPWPAQPWPA